VIKTFIAGLILGIAGVAGALYAVPAVDLHREASIVSVQPNGGNAERFHVSLPADRIMVGGSGTSQFVPAGLAWPDDPMFRDTNVELFKLRNERDVVVGVAGRLAARGSNNEAVIEWVLHLPARGSVYITMDERANEDDSRSGSLRYGTREFESWGGLMTERFVPADSDADRGATAGRIQLETSFTGVGDSAS
jgi:hypothetical protein